jgi:hypothetical protein
MRKNKLTLALDIDSTIWDSEELYQESAIEIFGHGYDPKEITHFDSFKDKYGENFWAIFNRALHPKLMHRRKLYPGVVDAVGDLKNVLGMNIHFITHNIYPDLMRSPLKRWLGDSFGEVGLSITTTGNKIPILKRIGAYGIVDDKFETLIKAQQEGFYACAKAQNWNRELVHGNPDIDIFEDWIRFEREILFKEAA